MFGSKIFALGLVCVVVSLPATAAELIGSGTGFLVNKDGWLVTNAHVIQGCDELRVPGFTISGTPIADEANDLAAIQLQGDRLSTIAPLAFRSATVELGEDVIALGYPLSEMLSTGIKVTKGNVNALIGLRNDTRYIQVSAPIQPGNSGGPLLDAYGLVLGVNSSTLSIAAAIEINHLPQNVNFSIRSEVILTFLSSNSINYSMWDSEEELRTSVIAARTAPAVVPIQCYSTEKQEPNPVARNAAPFQAQKPPPYPLADYPATIALRVRDNLRYPSQAQAEGIRGEVHVRFTIGKEGQLLELQVSRSSGKKLLDEAAIETIRRAAPFPPIPSSANRNRWPFTVPLVFSR